MGEDLGVELGLQLADQRRPLFPAELLQKVGLVSDMERPRQLGRPFHLLRMECAHEPPESARPVSSTWSSGSGGQLGRGFEARSRRAQSSLAWASTTASADRLTMPRVVTDDVTTCAGFAGSDQDRPDRDRIGHGSFKRLKAMLAASRLGKISRLASPLNVEFGQDAGADRRRERRIGVHLAVDLELRRLLPDQARARRILRALADCRGCRSWNATAAPPWG